MAPKKKSTKVLTPKELLESLPAELVQAGGDIALCEAFVIASQYNEDLTFEQFFKDSVVDGEPTIDLPSYLMGNLAEEEGLDAEGQAAAYIEYLDFLLEKPDLKFSEFVELRLAAVEEAEAKGKAKAGKSSKSSKASKEEEDEEEDEQEDDESEDEEEEDPKPAKGKSSKSSKKPAEEEEDEEEQEDEEDEEEEAPKGKSSKSNKSSKSSKSSKASKDEDEEEEDPKPAKAKSKGKKSRTTPEQDAEYEEEPEKDVEANMTIKVKAEKLAQAQKFLTMKKKVKDVGDGEALLTIQKTIPDTTDKVVVAITNGGASEDGNEAPYIDVYVVNEKGKVVAEGKEMPTKLIGKHLIEYKKATFVVELTKAAE